MQDLDDPFRLLVESYVALGYDEEEASLALAVHGGRAPQEEVRPRPALHRRTVNWGQPLCPVPRKMCAAPAERAPAAF